MTNSRIATSLRINPVGFCVDETNRFLKKYQNFYQYSVDLLLPETFVALAEGLNQYDEERNRNIIAFLKKRIEYRLLNYIKKNEKSMFLSDLDVLETSSQIPRLQSKIDVNLIIETLEGKELEIYYMYFVKNCTLKDIGEKIGLSTSRVHQLLGSVKEKVRSALDGRGKGKKKG